MNNNGKWTVNITKCCHASIMFEEDEDRCSNCRKIVKNDDYYQTELTPEEIEFFNLK